MAAQIRAWVDRGRPDPSDTGTTADVSLEPDPAPEPTETEPDPAPEPTETEPDPAPEPTETEADKQKTKKRSLFGRFRR